MILAALQLSHLTAAFIFSLFASIVFGVTQRNDLRDMVRYGAYCFVMFIGLMFAAGWVMWFLHH